ncbi:Alpha/Beta hydrolase protein [Dactylonectria macrodidyma]|uniref:Alpha/Beta hydrolase protein n=1 Tax=Dactylonectria macrodidyma TaxID=307937 RepID=A0A9P9IWZ7_9HYPO|nr:Alpha/Beta hydrolase protein [Dactylonectria macrodidyma]
MASDPETPSAAAARYIAHERFHRTFILPSNADHEALTVGYADVGRAPETPTGPSPPTILFMQGMFASRYLGIALHAIAEGLGVRVLVVDRPGMGKSTDVPLQQRISVWLELVPRLLEHLGIKHVAIASHSAGTLYSLNTLYHLRDILDPERPSITLLAPWVEASHSHVLTWQVAQYIPVSAFSIWNLIPKFFLVQAQPALATSGAVFTKASNVVSSGMLGGGQDNSELEKNRRRIEEAYGLPRDVQAEIDTQVFKLMFGESTVGANSEALQCLKKGQGWSWGSCGDYEAFVREIATRERERQTAVQGHEASVKLKVTTIFAETDALIGKKGQTYMEACWHGKDGEFQDVLDYETHTIAGGDHDSVVQSAEVLKNLFTIAGGVVNSGPE